MRLLESCAAVGEGRGIQKRPREFCDCWEESRTGGIACEHRRSPASCTELRSFGGDIVKANVDAQGNAVSTDEGGSGVSRIRFEGQSNNGSIDALVRSMHETARRVSAERKVSQHRWKETPNAKVSPSRYKR